MTATTATGPERLRQHLVDLVSSGLEPHSKLPTERELADQFEVTRLTVSRALGRLENEGRIYRMQGSGTFVAAPRIAKSVELASFSEDMRARGLVPGSRVIAVETIAAGTHVGAKLRVSPSAEVYHIRRVRTADSEPMCLEESYLNPHVVPGLLDRIGDGSLYQLLEEGYNLRIEWAEQGISATALDPEAAELLNAAPFSPAFLVSRTSHDIKDRTIEYAESLYRGDRYRYELRIHR